MSIPFRRFARFNVGPLPPDRGKEKPPKGGGGKGGKGGGGHPGGGVASFFDAWAAWDADGTLTILDSQGVTSITDNAGEDWTINWTNAFANANYTLMGCTLGIPAGPIGVRRDASNPSTTAARIVGNDTAWVGVGALATTNTNPAAHATFNGQGTPALIAAHNVTSLTDVAAGVYTLNLTNALAHTNAAICGLSKYDESGANTDRPSANGIQRSASNPSTTAAKVVIEGALEPIQSHWVLVDTSSLLINAWVSLNGTGTPAIVQSKNCTSITDNASCDYTANWTSAFADGNYVVGVSAKYDESDVNNDVPNSAVHGSFVPEAGSVRCAGETTGGDFIQMSILASK